MVPSRPHAPTTPARTARVDALIAVGVGVVVLAAVLFADPLLVGGALLGAGGVFLFRRQLFDWTTMLFVLTLVVMLVPIRRYALPIPVGFALEPYRVLILGLLIALAVRLIRRGASTMRPVLWGWPIAIFLWTMFFSIMVNAVSLTESGLIEGAFSNIIQLTFLLSVVVLVRQMLTTERITLLLLNAIVFAGAFVGLFAFVERATRRNVFLMLQHFLPLTVLRDDAESLRAGGNRAYASSQHPIALSVLFCLIIPLAIYLIRHSPWPKTSFSRTLVYVCAIGAMMLGMMAAVSRTGVVTLGVMFLFVLFLRPRLAGILASVAVPLVLLVGLLLPRLFESMVLSLFDIQGLIASQMTSIGMAGQGRLADLPDALAEFAARPFTGTGLASRVVVGDDANAQILDNQWLGTLLETGLVGVVGLIALFVWPIVVMVRFVVRSGAPQHRRDLVLAIATASAGYAVAMLFFDAFAFMQALLMLFLLYAVAAWAMTEGSSSWRPSAGAAGTVRVRAERAV
ncbi:O-antigen ligase family protein [Microbacterium caowuchunii]|uniref:O-antigen ligase-related domain-containing protein n=1 Tax=Microbacterium caowuchunii TaxID=2614638 RepID=A0A5N0TCU4_9MICO|nr:O-antigen ligase family protein [Microbacterium caowuchunii]KAA9132913.1 hypothetical protein F6B40_10035 [Microbacterium caowuchunii]